MKKKYLWLLCILPFIGIGIYLSPIFQTKTPLALQNRLASRVQTQGEEDIDALDQVLGTYVSDEGLVDYSALQSDRATLDAYNASIGLVEKATFEQWPEEQQIAYLINAYNSLTLKSIINESPIKDSIKDILGVWKVRRHPLMQRQVTLDGIEHEMLRVDYTEPRIHMALVCAALSCPPLRPEAYRGDQLNAQLDNQVEIFLNRDDGFKIDRDNKEVRLSSIFKWFGEDWVPQYATDTGFTGNAKERAVLNFISRYLDEEDREYLKAGDYKVTYAFYDWSLNRQNAS